MSLANGPLVARPPRVPRPGAGSRNPRWDWWPSVRRHLEPAPRGALLPDRRSLPGDGGHHASCPSRLRPAGQPSITLFAALHRTGPAPGEEVRLRLVGDPDCELRRPGHLPHPHPPLSLGPARLRPCARTSPRRAPRAPRPRPAPDPELARLLETELAARTVYEGGYVWSPSRGLRAGRGGLPVTVSGARPSGWTPARTWTSTPGPGRARDVAAEGPDRHLRVTWTESPDPTWPGTRST